MWQFIFIIQKHFLDDLIILFGGCEVQLDIMKGQKGEEDYLKLFGAANVDAISLSTTPRRSLMTTGFIPSFKSCLWITRLCWLGLVFLTELNS